MAASTPLANFYKNSKPAPVVNKSIAQRTITYPLLTAPVISEIDSLISEIEPKPNSSEIPNALVTAFVGKFVPVYDPFVILTILLVKLVIFFIEESKPMQLFNS